MAYVEFSAIISGHQPLDLVRKAAFQGSKGGVFGVYEAGYDNEGNPPQPVTRIRLNCSLTEAPAVLNNLADTFPPPATVQSTEKLI